VNELDRGADDRGAQKISPRTTSGRRLPAPSPAGLRGLDWFVFFTADIQTGFGPFVAVYLTTQAWTQVDIGLVLTAGGLIALVGQMPGGAVVDAARSERFVAALAVVAIGASALALALWPIFLSVLLGRAIHAAASCVLGPAMAAISLGLVGHGAIGERLGRNARFASIGTGLAAAVMGALGYLTSSRYVFFAAAALVVPTLIALFHIRPEEIDPERAHGGKHDVGLRKLGSGVLVLLRKRSLLTLAACVLLFHLSNAAMLPLMGSLLTSRSADWATVLIGACIVVPQLVVAALSPWVGRQAQEWGRRPLLLAGFAALPVRGLLFALVDDPYALVAVQLLDGISAAALGVMVPLVVADVTRGTGRFNLGQGVVGSAVGIGASLSTTLAGYVSDHLGSEAAFLGLAAIAVVGLVLVWASFPETRPDDLA
jgi:MFS family permease